MSLIDGNVDGNTVKKTKLNINARVIEICPINDESEGDPVLPALRVEFYTCPPCASTTTQSM